MKPKLLTFLTLTLAFLLLLASCNTPTPPSESTPESTAAPDPVESTTEAATTAEPETEPVPRTLEGVPGNWYFSWDPGREQLRNYEYWCNIIGENDPSTGFSIPTTYETAVNGILLKFNFFQESYRNGEFFQARITIVNENESAVTFMDYPYNGIGLAIPRNDGRGGHDSSRIWIPPEDLEAYRKTPFEDSMGEFTLMPGESKEIERAILLADLQDHHTVLHFSYTLIEQIYVEGESYPRWDFHAVEVPFNVPIEITE